MDKLNHAHGGNIIEIAGRYGLRSEEVVDFSASINPVGMSKKARKAVVDRIDSVLHYPEQYADSLTYEIAKFYGINDECILPGNGSTELIYLIPRAFTPNRALVVIPTFSEYRNALEIAGCRNDTFLLSAGNSFKLEVDRLISVMESRYDILYICNPGNPTGALIPNRDILEIADNALKYGTLCIVDEAFIDFAEAESIKTKVVDRPNLIVLRSMTKFFGIPGMRVGFAVSCKENIDRMKIYKEPWSINTLGSIAAVESLRDIEYIEETRIHVSEERENLFSNLTGLHWLRPFPSVANYLLVRIEKDVLDSDKLFDKLAREGILVRSCSSFDGLGNRFFRVAVRKREENERLINGLRRAGG